MNYSDFMITLVAVIHFVVLVIICTRWCQMTEVSARAPRHPPTASPGFPVARPALQQSLRSSDQQGRAAVELLELEIFPDHHGIRDSDMEYATPELISLQPLQPQLLMAVPTTTTTTAARSNCRDFRQGPSIDPVDTFVVIDIDNSAASHHSHNERLIF